MAINGLGAAAGIFPANENTDKTAEAIEEKKTELKKTDEKTTVEKDSSKTSEELKKEINELEYEKLYNYKQMQRLEAQIEEKKKKTKDNIKTAQELQEKAIEEHKEEADKAVENNLAAYVEANKEGGKGMTKEELEANISKSMPDSPNLAKALAKYVTASRELAEIDTCLRSINDLIIDTKVIENDLKIKNDAYTDALKNDKAKETTKCKDPIGFMKNGARYDFIVDDGYFDSTSDFLGADNQWASMEALDKDGDKVINASELKDAGIKMVKTENGQKKVVDVADEFGQDFKVDLTSYTQGGSYDGIDTTKDTDGDGTVDQQLLGTYTIHVGNEDIKGYNTLDDTYYLEQEYGLKSDSNQDGELSEELKIHDNFFKEYSETSKKLSEDVNKGLVDLGLAENTITGIKNHAKAEGEKEANIFIDKRKKEEAEDAKKEKDEKEEKKKDEKKKK